MFCVTFQVYGEYRASLAFDLVSSRQKNVSEIHSLMESVTSVTVMSLDVKVSENVNVIV